MTIIAIAQAAQHLRSERTRLRKKHDYSLRELYRDTDGPGDHPLDKSQEQLDEAVRKAYGMKPSADPLRFLYDLNLALAAKETAKQPIAGPGLPAMFAALKEVISTDAVAVAES